MVAVSPVSDSDSAPSISYMEGDSICNLGEQDQANILCELVGATHLTFDDDDLDAVDMKPYCLISFGSRRVHKTKAADETGPNPIWTIDNRSLFLLSLNQSSVDEVLSIQIWTRGKDSIPGIVTNSRYFLGQVRLNPSDIFRHCNEERFECQLEDEIGEGSGQMGFIALRFRVATAADMKFVGVMNQPSIDRTRPKSLETMLGEKDTETTVTPVTLVTETDETQVAGASFVNALSSALDATRLLSERGITRRVRVKPYFDPDRREETTLMTSHDLKRETRRPSHRWVQAGSGGYGRLFVEILSCHDLPNVDVGEAVGNVTDSFVCAVFEDAVAQTEVIDDELSPHWLPWTQRAFCFGIMHPASMLYLGVFDYDLGPLEHEPIGRVAVNISSFQRNTQYTLKYKLYKSSNVTDRTPQGTITIRVRVEMFDEKAALLSALKPAPKIHVNVRKEKTFRVVRYTCFGEYDGEAKFDLDVVKSYINEIFEYKRRMSYCIGDSVRSLMFWRGQVEIGGVMLPIHSLIFYIMGSTLVERPYLAPSFFILSFAWMMMAASRVRAQHPSPWNCPPSFYHYLSILHTGKPRRSFERINARQGAEEAEAYDRAWTERLERDQRAAQRRAEMQQELNDIGDENIQTEVQGGLSISLMQRLGRYQGYVGMVCRFLRKIKIIVTWEESILSFWITAVCLAVGLVSLLLPWAFILTWTGRIVMWGFFGPHMKVVDLFLRNKSSDRDIQKIVATFKHKFQKARLRREEAVKLKAVKSLRFGHYITQIPEINLARHYDRPLPESWARVCRKEVEIDWAKSPRIPAQQLYGVMIPRPENASERNREMCGREQERLSVLEKAAALQEAMRQRKEDGGPSSVGYELVHSFSESVFEETDLAGESHRMALVPYQSRELVAFEEICEEEEQQQQVIKKTRPPAVFMVVNEKDNEREPDEFREGEAGLEVVAFGRQELLDDNCEDCRDGVCEGGGLDSPHQLSSVYRQSDSTFVAFYRS